ncbi:ABC transporter substrate-binding protein [Agrilactobacillus yilanensis]|uniref:ABC transporter substrate-binding protein n=1 Tax=Agrilactobacillus yilanensis TaxID=2485997 RepID=A0ABW4J366_9LACO|nr:ABC transporter substrate-binding protein [Agrilactobacillus yilanensis]
MNSHKKTLFVALFASLMALFVANLGQAQPVSAASTRTIKVAGTKYKIPKDPKRIVTNVYTGDVLTVKGNVVGATSIDLKSPYVTKKQNKKIKNLGLNLKAEAVLKLKPDLIITSNETDVKNLKKIAPVVYIPYGSTGNIKATVTEFGRILNNQKEAKSWQKKFTKEATKQQKRLKNAGIDPSQTTVGLFDMQSGKVYIDGAKWGRGGQALVTGLDFQLTDAAKKIDKGAGYEQVSLESLDQYGADWIFFSNTETTKGSNDSAIKDLKANPVWQGLDAVKNDHVVQLPFNNVYYFDGNAVYHQMKLITDAMLKQVK